MCYQWQVWVSVHVYMLHGGNTCDTYLPIYLFIYLMFWCNGPLVVQYVSQIDALRQFPVHPQRLMPHTRPVDTLYRLSQIHWYTLLHNYRDSAQLAQIST
jgi:hypothetical protein